MAASVHSTDDHKYWCHTIGDPWDASWIRNGMRERKNNQATKCVCFILFALVSWVAARESSIISTHLLSLYPFTGSWGWGSGREELTHSTNNHSRSQLEKPIVPHLSTAKKKSLDCGRNPEKNPWKDENIQTAHKKPRSFLLWGVITAPWCRLIILVCSIFTEGMSLVLQLLSAADSSHLPAPAPIFPISKCNATLHWANRLKPLDHNL